MTRTVALLCFACASGIGLTIWSQMAPSCSTIEIPTAKATTTKIATSDLKVAIRRARAQCSLPALDSLIATIKEHGAANAEDPNLWQHLAEAHLERALQRTHLHGIQVGKPTFTQLPVDFAEDLSNGLSAVQKSRDLGHESGELFRIEAGLMSQHITGLGTALKWNAKITQALESAGTSMADDPNFHVSLGLRKLLAPRWFGHDAQKALEHFEFAATEIQHDERPAIFAAMACYLQEKSLAALKWIERAVHQNPQNKYARVVLIRMQQDEDDPFGRNVTEEELAATKQ